MGVFWETQSMSSAGNGVSVTNLSCKNILIDAISECSIKALQATVRVNIRQHIQILYTLHYWFGVWFRCRERWPWHFSSVAVRFFLCKYSNRKISYLTCLLSVCFPPKPTKLNRRSRQRNYDWLVYVNRLRSGNHPSTFFWHREELIAPQSYRQSWVRQCSARWPSDVYNKALRTFQSQ